MLKRLVIVLFCIFSFPILVEGQYAWNQKAKKLKQLASLHDIDNSIENPRDSLEIASAAFEFFQNYSFGTAPKHLEYNGLDNLKSQIKVKEWVKTFMGKPLVKALPIKDKPTDAFELFRQWKEQFEASRYVLISIASAELFAFESDSLAFQMKVIVGTKEHPTPVMATYADAIAIYPYWTPTANIVFNEIIPSILEDSSYLLRNNFEVIDRKNVKVNPSTLDWEAFGRNNFHYTIRQGTGCDNSLGVLKVNIQNPYSIYLHDTPHTAYSQGLFQRKARYFSHGCIRLEKPLQLAKWLKPSKVIDEELLENCLIDQEPEIISLEEKVPVFIMYFTKYRGLDGEWMVQKDIYNLEK